jgi:hypothetical protein
LKWFLEQTATISVLDIHLVALGCLCPYMETPSVRPLVYRLSESDLLSATNVFDRCLQNMVQDSFYKTLSNKREPYFKTHFQDVIGLVAFCKHGPEASVYIKI